MRYFFEIAYDGTNYHGWQRQKNASSVQQTIEEALSTILRTEITITGSGRTDTGVHCSQQYFHADLDTELTSDLLKFKLNSFLPADISIPSVNAVKPDAHARFDAVRRSYQYHINQEKWPFSKGYSYYFVKTLDIKTMNEAAALLIGEKDFEAFSRVKTEVNNFICNIEGAHWEKEGPKLTFHITANRFLRGMVRAIVGTLLQVGEGKLKVADVEKIIKTRDRREAGAAAPAEGLFLTKVEYPPEIFI